MKSQKSSRRVVPTKRALAHSSQKTASIRTSSAMSAGISSTTTSKSSTPSRSMSTHVSRSRGVATSLSSKRSPSTVSSRITLSSSVSTQRGPGFMPQRNLDLHEYQSKGIMDKHNIRVQRGYVAETPDDAFTAAKKLQDQGVEKLVVKAQVHAGGRGKGFFKETGFNGGVKISTTPEDIRSYASEMLGNHLVTKQTGADGQLVSRVLVEEGIEIASEKYFAILMDRTYKGPVIMASPHGGMNIEEVAAKDPKAVKMIPVDITEGITDAQAEEAAEFIGFKDTTLQDAVTQIKNLYKVFIAHDATQVEINPLSLSSDNKVYAVDAKINFDDNAFFRQKDIFAQRDTTMEDPRDVAAAKYDLNYVGLDGNIGCMVNGAGLAMATMDIIKLNGGWPANFLDVGGGASAKQVEEAFKILTADPKVEAILVNIFGGIMKCDVIAEGIITAARNLELKVPLVVRLEGTNVQKGVEMLNNSGLAIISASDLDDAAQKACKAVGVLNEKSAVH